MDFHSNSRGRKILALINQNVEEPLESISHENENDNNASETDGNACSNEHSENTQRSRLNSSSSSSSSNSSSSSSSSPTSFIEDSDDSVKDPPYQPPKNQAPVSPISFDEAYDEQFRQSPVQSSSLITRDANNIPEQENIENATEKRGKRKRDENKWKKNVLRKLRNEGKSYVSTSNKVVQSVKLKIPAQRFAN